MFISMINAKPVTFGKFLRAALLVLFFASPRPAWAEGRIPPSVSRAVNHSYDLLEKGRFDEAVSHLLQFKNKRKDHYLIHFALGNCYMQAGNSKKAVEEYRQVTVLAPDYAPGWFNLAKSRYELQDYENAGDNFLAGYERAEEKHASDLYYAGVSYLSADKPDKALAVLDRLITEYKAEVTFEWKGVKVRALLALGRNREALPLIEDLADAADGSQRKQWREILLYQYIQLDMTQKALVYTDRLVREEPLEPGWWKGRTHLLLLLNRYGDALAALTVYSHLTPPTREEKKLMADLSASLNIPVMSAEILTELLSEKWDRPLVTALVQNYIALHHPDKALEWADRGLEKDPANPDLLMLKGDILFKEKDYAGAADVYKKLSRQDDSPGRSWLMLGYAAWNMDDIEAAIQAMERAAGYAGQRRQAGEALKSLMALRNRN